jgi:hypothetical protein
MERKTEGERKSYQTTCTFLSNVDQKYETQDARDQNTKEVGHSSTNVTESDISRGEEEEEKKRRRRRGGGGGGLMMYLYLPVRSTY